MLNSVKSFAITFCAATLIFGLISWIVVGMISKSLGIETVDTTDDITGISSDSIDNESDTSSESVEKPQTEVPLIDESVESNVVSGDTDSGIQSTFDPEEIKGESFTMLLVGTDYLPNVMNDYINGKDYIEYLDSVASGDTFVLNPRKIKCDSIVLIRVDKEHAEFIISPLPSNLKVQSAGVYTQLGDIYADKGIEYLRGIVTAYTGLTIDYYAVVTPESFESVIDEFGGITFNIPQDMEYTDESQELEINLKRGTTKLDGKTAFAMLRYNGYADDNVSRMKLAVSFLKAFISTATEEAMLEKIPSLYTKLSDAVVTDFSLADLSERLDLIFAYKDLTPVTIMYPVTKGTLDGEEVFEPSYSQALTQYKIYKIQ